MYLIFTGLVFMACNSPVVSPESDSKGSAGSLTITINDGISRNILPDLDMDPSYYLVEGSGPNGASFSENTNLSITREDLPVGEWTISVSAFNDSDTAIGSGSATATVSNHSSVEVNVVVTPYSGVGTLDLTVSWVDGVLDDPGISATLKLSDSTTRDLDFDMDGSEATFSASDIPAGFHTLIIKLVNGSIMEEITGAVELVRIAQGAITSGSISFDELNIASGNIEVGITPEIGEVMDVSILGANDSKPENEILFLTNDIVVRDRGDDDYDENFTCIWYLNGEPKSYYPYLLLRSYNDIGKYRIDLLVFSADGKKAGNATEYIEIVEQNLLPSSFSFHIETSNYTIVGEPGYKVTIPFDPQGTYDFDIRWGDGTSEHITSIPEGFLTHYYPFYSDYEGYDATIEGLCLGYGASLGYHQYRRRGHITEIYQWGDIKLHNKGFQFAYSEYLNSLSAEDTLDLSNITNMAGMFYECDNFNMDISDWDMSQVTNTCMMFYECFDFNQDLSSWDMSSVNDMSGMFQKATSFTNGENPAGLEAWSVLPECKTSSIFTDCPITPLPSWYTP